ncbi:MAG: tetratricopeptide repeat protein [Arenicellales bacterium]
MVSLPASITSFLVRRRKVLALALIVAVILAAVAGRYIVPGESEPAAAGVCDGVLGKWDWFNGGTVTFSEDKRAAFDPGSTGLPHGHGTWTCDAASGIYSITWAPGFVDTFTLSADGNTLSGRNTTGIQISGTRPGTHTAAAVDCSRAPATRGEGACSLLTPADLCRATGRVFSAGQRIRGNQSDTCRFNVAEGPNEQLDISIRPQPGSEREGFLNVLKNARNEAGYRDIPGLGDNAYTISDAYNKQVRLQVLTGERAFSVHMEAHDYRIKWNEGQRIAAITELGKQALARLGGGSPRQQGALTQSAAQTAQQQTGQPAQQSGGQSGQAATGQPLQLTLNKPGSPGVKDYLSGLDALEQAQWDQAIKSFDAAVKLEPENADYLTALGVAFTFARRLEDAEKSLQRANRLRPNNKAAKLWLATAIAMQGRFMEDSNIYPYATRDQYESAVRAMSHDFGQRYAAEALGDKLAVQQAMPGYEAAIRQFPTLARMFVDRTKPAGAGGALGSVLRQRGIQRYKAGDCAHAYRDLSEVYQANPKDKDVLYFLAGCKLQLGSAEGARADYTAVLLSQPNNANAVLGRALAHAALGDAPAARGELALARKMNPAQNEAYDKQVAKDLSGVTGPASKEQKSQLLDQLRQAVERGAGWDALTRQAVALVKTSQYGRVRADEVYQRRLNALRAAAAKPGAGARQFEALGQFLYEQALIVVGEAVEPNAVNHPYRPQTKESQARELADAETAIDKALALDPNNARALAFKGACRFKRDNDWVSAEKYLVRAIEIAPDDSVIEDLFATVMDYIAFVQAASAADLRSVKTWSDAYYIYYRYPSQAELKRADELDALAKRLWKKARQALEKAIAAAPSSAHADYYRSILAERDGDLAGAAGDLKKALETDPKFFDAAQRLSTIATKLNQIQLAYTAQSIATNLVQTSAAPMLKLAWIEFSRSAYDTAGKALDIAAGIDPSDPRVAAYYGSIARAQGRHALAASWFVAAAVLEEVRLSQLGLRVREKQAAQYKPDDVSRLLALDNAAATELNAAGRYPPAAALMDLNFGIYGNLSQQSKYTKSPYGLLPEPLTEPGRVPEAPTIEALVVWSAVIAGKANVGLKHLDVANRQFQWAAAYESRKPATMDQGMAVRIPGLWAKLGLVDVALRSGNGQLASQYMQGYGFPTIATPALKAEADRLRDALDAAGYRSGGQTYHDMLDQMKRKNQKQQQKQVW